MKKIILVIFSLFLLTSCGSSTDNLTFDTANLLTREELVTYVKNPSDEAKGKSTVFGAQISNDVGEEGDKHYYQVMLDPENYDLNIIIDVPKDQKLNIDQYILVEGVIAGDFKGENLLGGVVTNLYVETNSVKESSFIDAIAPALETININQTKSQHGVDIIIDKIEISNIDTRLFVEINNNSKEKISIYSFNFKLVAGGKNYSEEFMYHDEYDNIDTDLAPNTSTSGIITYLPLSIEELSNFIIMIDSPYSDNWELNFEDYIFEITK